MMFDDDEAHPLVRFASVRLRAFDGGATLLNR